MAYHAGIPMKGKAIFMNGYELPITYIKCEEYSQRADSVCDYSSLPRPYYSIAFILSGSLETVSLGNRESYKGGDILFIPRGSTYISYWHGEPKTSFISVHFDVRPFADGFGNKLFAVQKIVGFERLRSDFISIAEYGNASPMLSVSFFYSVMNTVLPRIEFTSRSITDARILDAVKYIESNASGKFTVDKLAESCNMSVSHFFRRFKEQTGVSPVDYRNRVLTSNAARLLCDFPEMSIEEVSSYLNFESSAYFRKLFKVYEGVTPREYRKLGGGI